MNTELRGVSAMGLGERSIGTSFARRDPSEGLPNWLPSSRQPAAFVAPYVLLGAKSQSGTITGEVVFADGGIGARGFVSRAGGDHLLDPITGGLS
jgi:2,3-dihydroxy-2,3-dihydrophenylpropionate dehydrogenase